MNYLDASIRGIKFQKNKSQIPKKKNDASIGELNPKRLKTCPYMGMPALKLRVRSG